MSLLIWIHSRVSYARTAIIGVLLAAVVSFSLAATGVLQKLDSFPPPLLPMVLAILIGAIWLASSKIGKRVALETPLWMLIGLQAFRLPLELLMHRAASEGVMPVQMSYSGYNFDIVTGATALVLSLALLKLQLPRAIVWLWNIMGFALLVTVVSIAIASFPLFAAFGTSADKLNTWVTYVPFVWLPAILVPIALWGHIVIARRLISHLD